MLYYVRKPDGTRQFRHYRSEISRDLITFFDHKETIEVEVTGILACFAELFLVLFSTIPKGLAQKIAEDCEKEIEADDFK